MNNKQLEEIRQELRAVRNEKHQQMVDDSEDEGVLGLMKMSESGGERKVVDRLLEILPEPEYDVVQEYQAAEKLRQSGINVDRETGLIDSRATINAICREKREEAKEIVMDRIEIEKQFNNTYILKDPITKNRQRVAIPESSDRSLDSYIEFFAQDIIENV